jgi:DNA-binding transcriptional LysR family regulator
MSCVRIRGRRDTPSRKTRDTLERIEDLKAFLAIVEKGSLSAAARSLRRTLQSVSRSLITVERSVGVELVRRTTRRSNPTEAGLAFYRRLKPAFSEIHDAKLEAAGHGVAPSGLLRVGASVLFAPSYVVPAIAAFLERYPQIEVDLKLSDRFVNLLEEDLDLAIRIGDLPDSDLKARSLGELRRVFFGAPSYFARHGLPKHPDDLARHQCVIRDSDRSTASWPFLVDGKRKHVKVAGRFRADATASVHAAVALGLGIGFLPLWQIRDLVREGAVKLILVNYEPPRVPIRAVWPATRLPPAKARLFVDLLAERLKSERL